MRDSGKIVLPGCLRKALPFKAGMKASYIIKIVPCWASMPRSLGRGVLDCSYKTKRSTYWKEPTAGHFPTTRTSKLPLIIVGRGLDPSAVDAAC